MNGNEEDLELNLEDEPQGAAPESLGADGATPPEKTPQEIAFAELQEQVKGLSGKAAMLDQFAPLMPQLQKALDKFVAPEVRGDQPPDPELMRQMGERLQSTLIAGKPEEAAAMFLDAVRQISKQNVDSEIARVGTPLADKAGDWTVSSYLNTRLNENPAASKTHSLIAKEFALTDQEKAYVGSAPAKEVRAWLDERYERTAGKLLLRSSKNATARDLSAGGSGGGAGRSGSFTIPGLNDREQREQIRLAEINWPDKTDGGPADPGRIKREQMLKALAASMSQAS